MYNKVLRPITTHDEYTEVDKLIQDFLTPGGEGETLQNKLIQHSHSTDNWVRTLSI